jgi:hypothetical protein
MNRYISAILILASMLIVSCTSPKDKSFQFYIFSEPNTADVIINDSLYSRARTNGIESWFTPSQIKALIQLNKSILFRWKSGAETRIYFKDLNYSNCGWGVDARACGQIVGRRPANHPNINIDYSNASSKKTKTGEFNAMQIQLGLEMMSTGKLPTGKSNTIKNSTPNYKSAITIGGVDICPRDPSLGFFSHSTSSGLNKICYYK